VVWCTSNYIPSKRTIISKNGTVLIELTTQSIAEMLRWPLDPDNETLNEFVLDKYFRELNPQDRATLLQNYLCETLDDTANDVTLETSPFPEIPRQIISMIYVILGKKNDSVVDEFIFRVYGINLSNYSQNHDQIQLCPIPR
jgi:hypothetical protein